MELKEFKNYEEAEDFFYRVSYGNDEVTLILVLINKSFTEHNWREKFVEYWNKGVRDIETENTLTLKQCSIKYILMIWLINAVRAL
jgi:hypothetical protein